MLCQVLTDRLGAGIEALIGEFPTEPNDQFLRLCADRGR